VGAIHPFINLLPTARCAGLLETSSCRKLLKDMNFGKGGKMPLTWTVISFKDPRRIPSDEAQSTCSDLGTTMTRLSLVYSNRATINVWSSSMGRPSTNSSTAWRTESRIADALKPHCSRT